MANREKVSSATSPQATLSFDSNAKHFRTSLRFAAYVKSNTVVGDSKHTTGVVLAEIVMGNIPVKNGVVHLIHRPLMVVDTTVAKFLEVCTDERKILSNLFFVFKSSDENQHLRSSMRATFFYRETKPKRFSLQNTFLFSLSS
jgi:hypothetical protein